MSIRRLRQVLTYLTIILATMAALLLFQQFQMRKGKRQVADEITTICKLPDIPEDLTIRHAVIDRSEDERFVDVILTLTGPTDIFNNWLEEVDSWEKKRPGVIQNHRIREAEMSSRVDFTAEVYLE